MKIQQWSLPIKSQRRASLAVALLAAFTAAQQPLRAQLTPYTFNWSDEYYCNSLSSYEGVFGGLATGYSSAGIYQAISTTANPTAPSPYYSGETVYASGAVSSTVRLATTGVPGEYVQTSTTGLPSRTEGLALVGWTQSLNPGYQVRNVFNANSTAPYFQYLTGNPLRACLKTA